jgi:hypothetical protein
MWNICIKYTSHMFHHPSKVTSVKVLLNNYEKFQSMVPTVQNPDTLCFQTFVNRALYLYLNDFNFRNLIDSTNNLKVSGSFL